MNRIEMNNTNLLAQQQKKVNLQETNTDPLLQLDIRRCQLLILGNIRMVKIQKNNNINQELIKLISFKMYLECTHVQWRLSIYPEGTGSCGNTFHEISGITRPVHNITNNVLFSLNRAICFHKDNKEHSSNLQ